MARPQGSGPAKIQTPAWLARALERKRLADAAPTAARPTAAAKSVAARFGQLGASFGTFLPAGTRFRSKLEVSPAEHLALEQLLYHYREAGCWVSVGQDLLARELGVARPTLNEQLARLRRGGLISSREDPRFGKVAPGRQNTLFYCLDPYLAALALLSAAEAAGLEAERLQSEGESRLSGFVSAVSAGQWQWRVGDIASSSDITSARAVEAAFRGRYGLPTVTSIPATRVA